MAAEFIHRRGTSTQPSPKRPSHQPRSHHPEVRFADFERLTFVPAKRAPAAPSSSHPHPQSHRPSRTAPAPASHDASGFNGAWVTPSSAPIHPSWPFVHAATPGLRNFGNTCYMNAVLQCLMHCPPLVNALLAKSHREQRPGGGGGGGGRGGGGEFCAFCAMQALAGEVHGDAGARRQCVAPKSFVSNVRAVCRTFKPMRQEDAHEFLRHVLDKMVGVVLRGQCGSSLVNGKGRPHVTSSEEMHTIVHRVFGGCLQSTIRCSACDNLSVKHDPFLDLSLDILRCDSVTTSLHHFTKPERLDGNNKYHCERCQRHVTASKRMSIRRAPNVLVLHLKRFDGVRKNTKPVQYPDALDLAPFLIGAPRGTSAGYRLCGVLVHAGASTRSGHYYAFVKGSNGAWTLKDDAETRQVGAQTVLGQKAYVLFYSRVMEEKVDGVGGTRGGDVGIVAENGGRGQVRVDEESEDESDETFEVEVTGSEGEDDLEDGEGIEGELAGLLGDDGEVDADADAVVDVDDGGGGDVATGDQNDDEVVDDANSPRPLEGTEGVDAVGRTQLDRRKLRLCYEFAAEECRVLVGRLVRRRSRPKVLSDLRYHQELAAEFRRLLAKDRATCVVEKPPTVVKKAAGGDHSREVECSDDATRGVVLPEAGRWSHVEAAPANARTPAGFAKRGRVWDSWDAEYDEGRGKRVRQRQTTAAPSDAQRCAESRSPFQLAYERRLKALN